MKAIKIFSLALSFAAIALTGCKDPCKDVACQNAGTCDDGTCICATGYEGTNCETEQRAKFLATYNVQESCTFFGNDNFTISIAPSAQGGVTGVVINNMYNVNATVSANVSGTSLTIPNQTSNVQGLAITFSGSGQISGNILTLNYNVAFGTDSDSCSATGTKQ